ncbi:MULTISPECIES: hypothetical protein [Vibrio]|uniref:hypothetical protein n=1 Tax=Vibrio TaxID=662 RepID=UPI001EFE31D4|nr:MULTISPECIES: hypothetical protein [Vibrio]EIT7146489.1 hypothetical protein [Vibrio vulnificus]MCG9744742.1 hypothetical protein [Vibrio alginolyticus]MDW1637153.1 hypothetical protein [Vibrio sp. Vb2907]MDW1707926.1 hypothetical protein [Vibrio sp. Vb2917]MDW1722465.1 hypothetical protein [Vibrio sp. Vb2979]
MFHRILKSFSGINASLSSIETQYRDKKETKYKALYDYITKQNDIEIGRTRALEAKTSSFFPMGSLIATAYTSILLLHLKSKFDIDLLAQYSLLLFGAYFFLRASYFWWKAIHVKNFTAPNTTTIKKTIVDKCENPEETYNHLYNTVENVVNKRKVVNKEFGLIVSALSKNMTRSIAFLILATASTPISWYSNTLQSNPDQNYKYEVYVMLNYSEPEDLPLDDEDIMMEGIEPDATYIPEEE